MNPRTYLKHITVDRKLVPSLLESRLASVQLYTALLFTVVFSLAAPAYAQDDSLQTVESGSELFKHELYQNRDSLLVYSFELARDIMPPAWRIVQRAVDEAEAMNADVILLKLNTYGGMVNIADSISSKLLNSKPLSIVYITTNAASAGALISISCDSIYMKASSRIGAATVVSGADGQAMPDKYQAYMRGTMRGVAQRQGRDPEIAEAMVDQDIEIEGIIEAGKTLVFTAEEALEHDFCDGVADSWKEALSMAGIDTYKLVEYTSTPVDQAVQFFLNPVVSGLLLMLIFFGIYSELQTPGVGFPLAIAIIAGTLYFAPHYLDGLAQSWEIALFFVGVVLLGIELFVIPGFGIAGVAGLALMVSSMVLSLIQNNNFDFSYSGGAEFAQAFMIVIFGMLGSFGLIYLFLRNVETSGLFSRLVLTETQESNSSQTVTSFGTSAEKIMLEGAQGIAMTDLRPSGKVEIEDDRFDAMSEGEYILRGDPIEVIEVRANHLLVRKIQLSQDA